MVQTQAVRRTSTYEDVIQLTSFLQVPITVTAQTHEEAHALYTFLNRMLGYKMDMKADKGKASLEATLDPAHPAFSMTPPYYAFYNINLRPTSGTITEVNLADKIHRMEAPMLVKSTPELVRFAYKNDPGENGTFLTVHYNPK